MKPTHKLLQTKLATTLSAPELQKEVERHLGEDLKLNAIWLVPSWEHAFELHGFQLHGHIQCYHFRIPDLKQDAVLTLEFCKGDEVLVKHLIKLLCTPTEHRAHTKLLLGQKNRESDSELAEFLNHYKPENPAESIHISDSAIESARHCSWFSEDEIISEFKHLGQLSQGATELGFGYDIDEQRNREQQLCHIYRSGKTIWFQGHKIKLVHQAHIICPKTTVILVAHFAYHPKDGKAVIGYFHQYNEL
jgi:hypothetical protein